MVKGSGFDIAQLSKMGWLKQRSALMRLTNRSIEMGTLPSCNEGLTPAHLWRMGELNQRYVIKRLTNALAEMGILTSCDRGLDDRLTSSLLGALATTRSCPNGIGRNCLDSDENCSR